MVILVALTVGLVWWVSAWSLGIKSFDAFMVTGLIVVLAAGWYVMRPYLQAYLRRGHGVEPS
jgi:hypothetical protein